MVQNITNLVLFGNTERSCQNIKSTCNIEDKLIDRLKLLSLLNKVLHNYIINPLRSMGLRYSRTGVGKTAEAYSYTQWLMQMGDRESDGFLVK